MAFLLWVNEADDEAVDLGNPFTVLKSFGVMAKVIGRGTSKPYAELFSVPQFGEQNVDPKWMAKVRSQASAFLKQYAKQLDDHTRWILQTLSGAKS